MRIYELGARVYGNAGDPWGWITQLVLKPDTRRVSHAVVYSSEDGRARLVPIEMTRPIPQGIGLTCSLGRIEAMTSPVAVHLVDPAAHGRGSTDSRHVAWWPPERTRTARDSVDYPLEADEHLPSGTVAVSQQEPVEATDGDVGKLRGLVLAQDSPTVTHLIVERKHLLSRKRKAVPARAIAGITSESIRLGWTRRQVKELPRFAPEDAFDA